VFETDGVSTALTANGPVERVAILVIPLALEKTCVEASIVVKNIKVEKVTIHNFAIMS
jgi:hypothetical protein